MWKLIVSCMQYWEQAYGVKVGNKFYIVFQTIAFIYLQTLICQIHVQFILLKQSKKTHRNKLRCAKKKFGLRVKCWKY